MKKITLLVLSMLLLFISAFATSSPSISITPDKNPETITLSVEMVSYISKLKIKDVEKLLGRKLKLKEKVGFKIYQWKIKKELSSKKVDGEKDKGKTAMMLGFFAAGALLLSPILFFSWMAAIPLAIIAIIMGNKVLKDDKNDKNAKTGVILGWVTLGLMVIGTIVIIAILAAIFSGGW